MLEEPELLDDALVGRRDVAVGPLAVVAPGLSTIFFAHAHGLAVQQLREEDAERDAVWDVRKGARSIQVGDARGVGDLLGRPRAYADVAACVEMNVASMAWEPSPKFDFHTGRDLAAAGAPAAAARRRAAAAAAARRSSRTCAHPYAVAPTSTR